MSKESNRNHARGLGRWLALVSSATTAIVLGAYSIASTESEIEFMINEYKRSQELRARTEEPAVHITVRPLRTVRPSRTADGAVAAGSYCVRTCDGFYFPLSPQQPTASEARSLCNALCPAAATEVYSLRGGSASFDDALSTEGKSYSQMGNAFAYRQQIKASCTCRSSTTAQISVTQDPTLRPGDIVVTSQGVRIFQGDRVLPHKEHAFVDFRKSRSVSGSLRNYLVAIDRPYRTREATNATPIQKSSAPPTATHAEASVPSANAKEWIKSSDTSDRFQEREIRPGAQASGNSHWPDASR